MKFWLFCTSVVSVVSLILALSARDQIGALRAEIARLRKLLPQDRQPQNETRPAAAVSPAPQPVFTSAPKPAPKPVYAAKSTASGQKGEFFVGKIILSVAAAVLVFIGLIYLALDDKDGIPDWIRIGSMFAVSAICLVSGLIMGRKKRDNFNLALVGCGVGSLFIAILLTHVWFGYMADWMAFGLLLVWSVAALWLTRRTDSLLLSVIAHIGMLTSTCFGYSLGLSDDKLVLLLVYQFASSAVIILGNMLCYRRTYHVGLLVSLAMTAIAGAFMWEKFTPRMELDAFLFNSELPIWLIALAFYAQFIAATYLSYLLSVSAARIRNETLAGAVQIANKFLWIVSAGINFCLTTFNVLVPVVSGGKPYSEVPLHSVVRWKCFFLVVAASFVVWILHLIVTDLFRTRLSFARPLALISTVSGAVGMTALLLWFGNFTSFCDDVRFRLMLFSVPALILLVYSRISGEKAHRYIACGLFAADYLCMFFGGYEYLICDTGRLGILWALLYFAVPLAAVLLDYFFSDAEYRRKNSIFVRLFSLFVTEFSCISICAAIPGLGYGYHGTSVEFTLNETVIPALISLLLLACYVFGFDRPTVTPPSGKRTVWTPVRIVLLTNELVLLLVNAVTITQDPLCGLQMLLQTILFAVSLALAFCRVGEFVRCPDEYRFLTLLAGVKLTVLVMCFLCGTAQLIESRYVFSVVCMLTALVSVVCGFFIRSKPLRLWGLLLTIACVLKLVTYDMSGTSALTHIVSFILGGVICFAISAVYTVAEKKLLGTGNEQAM